MRISAFLFFLCLSLSTAYAQSTNSMQSGSMQSGAGMTMPTCKAGDSVVGVNMQTKMYMTKDQLKTKMAGMSPAQKQSAMQKHHVKLMCKSDADAMGAKPTQQ